MWNHLLACLETRELTKFPRNPEQRCLPVKRQAYKVVLVWETISEHLFSTLLVFYQTISENG